MNLNSLFSQGGVIITILLITLPIIAAAMITIMRSRAYIRKHQAKKYLALLQKQAASLTPDEVLALEQRKKQLEFQLANTELGTAVLPDDRNGLIDKIEYVSSPRFVHNKKRAQPPHAIDPKLKRLIIWFIGSATFWLIFGTSIGEYLGIKFVAPDVDQLSWLSFGRLRPVHTNAVFWGWSSLAMLGLAYYVVPRVGNVSTMNLKYGYWSLALINVAVIAGTICLMAGINNGGGEYREYIWPVKAVFAIGVVCSLLTLFSAVARRKTKEIYISNWYIISALFFVLVIIIAAYWPGWQNGLGETVIQGYYMHQGVGMWFMLFSLGLMYYFLPQQLNRPIYSYSLGILAFWTQILFYTVIGTHHFIFSAIPWWLQTVAIIGSVGMVIPVVAGTTNFLLTFKGSWNRIASSYTLPFYLISIVFYFTGSLQGTAEAFRFTNLIWHFTDFTVAHSHLTMYGIIAFMLWAFIYTIIPRLTGIEPPQVTVGMHFWFALIGLLFYTVPLMIGATEKGMLWMEGRPFIESVEKMAPHWLWRAIGGTFMWISHLVFAYNFYYMISRRRFYIARPSPTELLKFRNQLKSETNQYSHGVF